MQVATVPVQICTGTVACAYIFLTIFSFSVPDSQLPLRGTPLFFFLSSIFLPLPSIATAADRSFFLWFSLFSGWMGLISGFRVEWGWMSLAITIACLWRHRSCFSFSPSPPKVSILLLKARRRFRVGCVDCVVGFVSIPGCWIVWIVLIPGALILLLGLFF